MMNLESFTWKLFSTPGYIGVGMVLVVLLLWLIHFLFRAKSFICHFALILAVAAFVLAKYNSITYVNLIQLDPAAQKAADEARRKAQRDALLESRKDNIAQIRFAEDDEGEQFDRAGMEESDLEYLDKLNAEIESDAEPEWKKTKKSRTGDNAANKEEKASEVEPILMPEPEMTLANQLDLWHLRITKWMIILGLGIVILDNLRRANIYREAYFPRRIPSLFLNALTPHPPLVERTERPRRKMPQELAWLLRRGDSFVYLTDNHASADEMINRLETYSNRRRHPVEILRIGPEGENMSDEFAFEAWWYGRASIVVEETSRAQQLMERFLELLEERKNSRARIAQTAHIVWDLASLPIPITYKEQFQILAKRTGVSLMIG